MVSPSLYVEVDSLKIGLDNGFYENAFLSHAHSDHTRGIKKAKKLLSSKETKHILNIDKEELKINGVEMRNAGHILGAKQLLAEEDGGKTVYTGDIRIKDGILEKGAEIIECDKLIIEATYAKRNFSFPSPFEVYDMIAKETAKELLKGNAVVFTAYPLGKTQELIRVINEYLSLPVLTDEKQSYFSEKYKELGIKLDFVPLNNEEAKELTRESFVMITSQNKVNSSFITSFIEEYAMPVKLFTATGWSQLFKFKKYHKTFPLSDHADFKDILYYIEQSNANEVIFFGGDAKDIYIHYKVREGKPVKISMQK